MKKLAIHGGFVVLLAAPVPAQEEPAFEPVPERQQLQLYRTSRELRELAHVPISSNIFFGAQLELIGTYEKQGDTEESDILLDGVEFAFDAFPAEGLEGHVLLSYESVSDGAFGDGSVVVDEAFVRIGGIERIPPYIEAGRMELPFGEFNSSFIEDPLVQILGETKEDAAIFGYENEWMEVSAGVYRGQTSDSDDVDDAVAALKFDPLDFFEVGVSWTSHLGGSDELRTAIGDALRGSETQLDEEQEAEAAEDAVAALQTKDVDGFGAFLSVEWEGIFLDLEYITALDPFQTGLLDDSEREPSAWLSEVAWQPSAQWKIGARYEESDDLPITPERRYGVVVIYGFSEYVTVAAEYLRGEFPTEPDRDLVTVQLGLRY